VPEFEVRIIRTGGKQFETILIDAKSEIAQGCGAGEKTRRGFLRGTPSQRWVRRD
jgi:hypothetical protein